ncbi:gamma-glutamyltransferase family protein [Ornithinimicrobium cavernae]|uniref:gamma-glutamyltransferase family protein n=1 Tax=Ornithinimicrobium cavernae TaxID=2666047 RepID=UPI000D694654|nr:gamma-glutamyltransferase [Ornithinimicrobium cavernae]
MTAFVTPAAFTSRPTLEGTFGMSASTHWLATATSQSVLERGGNAFDAAVAGAFVLHVVEPHLNGPAGDMTGIFATAEDPSRPVVMMGQGAAPAGATIEHYRALGLELVPGSGALAAAIPAAVDAWLKLLEEHGTWELGEVLAYAIGYAEDGHPVLARVCHQIAAVKDLFEQHWPTSAERWMPGGRVPEPGELIRNAEYARVLRELVAAGEEHATRQERVAAARHEWRTGRVARLAAEFVRTPHRHSDGGDYAGVITEEDFAGSSAQFEEAATVDFRGYTVAKAGLWSQGPVLLEALRILDGFPDERLDPSTELGAHTILETLKLALADRDTHYGDNDTAVADLLSEEFIAARRALVGERASAEFRPGTLPGGPGHLPPLVTDEEFAAAHGSDPAASGGGEPTVPGARGGTQPGGATPAVDPADPGADADGSVRGDTCHIDVVDRWGNMISATPSGGWLQSSPTIPGLGFCLGTRLQMTWLDEASRSALEPGRRPRTTLTPTLVLRDGAPVIALGSPGGDQQDQWQLLLVLRLLVGGYEPQQAIDAPALHTTSTPGSFWPRTWQPGGAVVEDRLGDDVIAGLEARGHRVTRAGDWALGRLSCVTRDPGTGVLTAAANPRGAQGYAAGR